MKKLAIIALAIMTIIMAACSNSGNNGGNAQENAGASAGQQSEGSGSKEPVTLKVLRAGITVTETEFQTYLVDAIKDKYPHITLEWVDAPEDVELEPLITQGTVPDIIFASTTAATSDYERLDLVEDLTPYVEKYGVDLNRLKPVVLETIKTYSPDNKLSVLPLSLNLPVLFYNKEIFDKFGVPYPKDEQMTWDETIELGKQVTKADGGVNYIGFDVNGPTNIHTGLDLTILDPATGESTLTTNPGWEKVFNVLKKSYEVPGFIGSDGRYQYANDDDIFFNEQNLAMLAFNLAHLVGPLEELRQQGVEIDWDFAPFPNFSENLGTNRAANVHAMLVTKTSKHKDEAFQVIANVLTDEVQEKLARTGRIPTVENEEFEKLYGADIPVLQGKTIANIFTADPRAVVKPHEFESDVRKFVNEAAKRIALEGIDVNTAIREADEAIKKELQTLNTTK
jgi:multiple sugar transport system substrate-binding protein